MTKLENSCSSSALFTRRAQNYVPLANFCFFKQNFEREKFPVYIKETKGRSAYIIFCAMGKQSFSIGKIRQLIKGNSN